MIGADINSVKEELKNVLGIDPLDAVAISAKTGKNISRLIRKIIKILPSASVPQITYNKTDYATRVETVQTRRNKQKLLLKQIKPQTCRAYIFDSWFEINKGCFFMIRVYNGELAPGNFVEISSFPEDNYEIIEVGIFSPNKEQKESLKEGEVGYIFCGVKDPKMGVKALGKTMLSLQQGLDILTQPKMPSSVVFASIFPETPDEADYFFSSVDKILLEDPAIKCEKDTCLAMGNGFRCGFLGELHLEIFQQRLFDEFDLKTIITPASVVYQVYVLF